MLLCLWHLLLYGEGRDYEFFSTFLLNLLATAKFLIAFVINVTLNMNLNYQSFVKQSLIWESYSFIYIIPKPKICYDEELKEHILLKVSSLLAVFFMRFLFNWFVPIVNAPNNGISSGFKGHLSHVLISSPTPPPKKKNPPGNFFFIFTLRSKHFFYFQQWDPVIFSPSSKNKKINTENKSKIKTSYISGNGTVLLLA